MGKGGGGGGVNAQLHENAIGSMLTGRIGDDGISSGGAKGVGGAAAADDALAAGGGEAGAAAAGEVDLRPPRPALLAHALRVYA
jgi:hypothetical protein